MHGATGKAWPLVPVVAEDISVTAMPMEALPPVAVL